ncbi:MAG: DUF2461 domain-containing protein [Tannerella sp.]|jgi:uncharacterized protein (TIGR02453 family)|nr:DUF2461 domain-containing protein [Tannerella sp.]
MKEIVNFLIELRQNNNREWFEDNKNRYNQLKKQFEEFVEELIVEIAVFDPIVQGNRVKDCTYRIYRDTRFSPNKEPYKTYMGAYICRGGKKSGYAGYYMHLEPHIDAWFRGSALTAGLYMPSPEILRSLRDEIYDNGDALMSAIGKAEGFSIETNSKLKRLPAGYQPGPYDELLKQKDLYIVKNMDFDWFNTPKPVETIAAQLKTTHEFIDMLNRSVDYVYGL